MVSKNNRIKRMEEAAERQSHFGIRKLTVGAASVLLGITLLFGANAKVARADETNAQTGTSAVETNAQTGTSAVETKVTTGASAAESDNNKGKKTNQSSTDVHVLDSNESTTINNGENEAKGVTQKTTSMVAVKTRQSNKQALDIAKTTGASAQPNVNTGATQGADTKQDKNPDWYMTDPSKATDEMQAHKNLEEAIAYVKTHPIKGLDIKGEQDAEGRITVAPDPKEDANDAITIAYDNEKDSAQYMQSIANKIWDEIKTYEAYEAERETFMDGLAAEGLYNPKTDVDPTTLSQHLTLDSEPDAIVNLEIKDNNGKWIPATKNGLETDNLETKENDLLKIYNGAEKKDLDAMGSKRGWTVTFKNHASVNDDFIRLTFTNLKNSHYDDGTNAAVVPIDKIVETFSDVHATDGAPAKFVFANDPTRGWWYNHCSGVTAKIQLYGEYDKTDKDGKVEKEEKLITLNQPVYMSVSSLNSGEKDYKESAQLLSDGEAYRIPESSVIADNKKLYSPHYNNWYLDGKKDTDYYNYWGTVFEPAAWKGATDEKQKVENLGKHIVETYKGWDNPDQYNRIFGSGLYKVNGDKIIVRSYVGGSKENQSISKYNHVWFAYSTIIPKTTFDAKHPGTTINYHFAKAINVNTSQTVEFVDDQGNQLIKPNDIQSGFSFQIKDGKPTVESHTYNNVSVPVIDGYVADKTRIKGKDGKYVSGPNIIVDKDGGTYVPGQKVTVDNPNVTIEVVYHKIGTISVKYHDTTDNVDIPGYGTTDQGNENDPFSYNPNSDLDKLEDKGYVKDGDLPTIPTHYTDKTQTVVINVKHGVRPVDKKHPVDPQHPVDPDNPDNPNNKKDIPGLTHNDLEKTVTRDFTYNFTDGSNHPEAKEDPQTVTFEGHATIDKVTGQLVTVNKQGNITGVGQVQWDKASEKLQNVDAKTVDGYHVVSASNANADGSVDALEVYPNSGLIHVVINYAPNNEPVFGKQIVHYVDGDNNNRELMDDSINSTCVFTKDDKTGKWKEDSYKFSNATAPVIYGYVAKQKTYEGQVATPTDPNKEITIVYHKIGNIVPVDKDGKEIPDAPTPDYKNDPTDPTKVTPDESTPSIPGYHITDNENPGKNPDGTPNNNTVTPNDPTKPTHVTYTKDPEPTKQGSITVKYHDTTDNVDIPGYGTTDQGNENDPFSYNPNSDLDKLEDKGYVKDGDLPTIPTHYTDKTQTVVINVKHSTITVTPDKPGDPKKLINPNDPDPKSPKYPEGTTKNDLTKDSTQTTIYHYSDGSKPDEKKTETHKDTFTRTKVVDKVTGEVIKTTPWTGSHTFDSKDVPVVNGYHSDKRTVGGKTATVNNPDVTDTVTYTPNGKIIPVDPSGKPIPNVPTPTYPTDPNDPTKVVPNEPVPDVPGRTPEVSTVTPKDPSKDTPVVYNSIPNVPGPSVGPSDNTPTPVTPTPGNTTEEKKPDENKDDKDVDEPDDDEDVVPTPRHHKKHNGGESSTTRPRLTGYTPAPRGSSYLDANGKVHYKLPQTGESDSEEMAAVLGGAAAAIGLIGLAGAKKRRHE